MYTRYVRFYDAEGVYICTSVFKLNCSYKNMISSSNKMVGWSRLQGFSVTNTEHVNHISNGGTGLSVAAPLLATNISIKDEKGRFVPWRNI